MISIILGCMEASIEIMAKLIPIILTVMYYVFIVLPVAIFHGIVEVVKSLVCYFKGKDYIPPEPEISYEVRVEPERQIPKTRPLKAKTYRAKPKKAKKWHEPFTLDELIMYDMIDDD